MTAFTRSSADAMTPFADRRDAGRALGDALVRYRERDDVIVLGLPRGGVPVAWEVARALDAPLDVFLVRKLGVPGHEELAMGAIATGGVRVLNDRVVAQMADPERIVAAVAADEQRELERRERSYRGQRPTPDLNERVVILVDDGLATGASMRAAVAAVGAHDPAEVAVAVPVGAPQTCRELAEQADDVVCVHAPPDFRSVGTWYEDFSPTSDDEVRGLLSEPPAR